MVAAVQRERRRWLCLAGGALMLAGEPSAARFGMLGQAGAQVANQAPPGRTIRVGPTVVRAFEAGSEPLELLVFSRRAPGDAELVPDFWND